MSQDFYKILGVAYTANAKTIQKAFHKLAKQLHPDKNPQNEAASEKFKLISEAYKTLSHPVKKKQYDLRLHYGYRPPAHQYRTRYATTRRYRTVKKSFTRRAQYLGGLSIVVILATVMLTSFVLMRYNAKYNFQRGLSNFQNKKYSAAYFNLKQSLGPFNPYQAAAHLLMADICFNQQAAWVLTSDHIRKALEAQPSDSIKGRLHYLQGKLSYQQQSFHEAYSSFEKAAALLPNFDSAYYQMGEMDTFYFTRFQKALEHYQFLADRNHHNFDAYIGMAYCHHQLKQYESAMAAIDQSLKIRKDVGMAYYIKGLSAQSLKRKEVACQSFQAASDLGLVMARDSVGSYCPERLETTIN